MAANCDCKLTTFASISIPSQRVIIERPKTRLNVPSNSVMREVQGYTGVLVRMLMSVDICPP